MKKYLIPLLLWSGVAFGQVPTYLQGTQQPGALAVGPGVVQTDANGRAFIPTAGSLGTVLSAAGLVGTAWPGVVANFQLGTATSPTIVVGPLIQLSKTQNIASSLCGGNALDASCDPVISAIVTNTASDQMMPVAIFGNASTKTINDAVAVYGIGNSLSGATGIGTGAYFQGTAASGGAKSLGAEIRSANNTGVAGTYQSSGFSGTGSLWLTAGGTAVSSEAIGVGGVSSQNFLMGLACKSGSVSFACLREDASSTNGIDLEGTHTTAILLGANAGLVNLGVQIAEKLRIFDGGGSATSYGLGVSGGDFQAFLGGTANQFSWRGAGYNSTAVMTLSGLGALKVTGLPASAGSGGLFVCVDNVGAFYKKATCP